MNLNMRYANKDIKSQFYPVFSDLEQLTQEKNVSIKEPNSILYSSVFSLPRLYANSQNLPARGIARSPKSLIAENCSSTLGKALIQRLLSERRQE